MLMPPDSAGGCGKQLLPSRASPDSTKQRQTALSNVRFITRNQSHLFSSARREPVTRFRLRGINGLYHTFAFSGKIKDSSVMMSMLLLGFHDKDSRERSTMKGLFTVCVLLSVSCHTQTTQNTKTDSSELIVAAAANLTDAFTEIGARFTRETGIRVVFSFGATADLSKQMENGAPFDVFAAADTAHIDLLEREGLLTPG